MFTLDADEQAIVDTVRDFVDREVRPQVQELEHANTYPEKLIEQMKEMGVFGLAIPEPYGDVQVSAPCYALVTEELARGWMSLAGAMGGHTVVAKLLLTYGTEEQKQRYLPRMATGELRATMALTEPGGGSDLQAMRTVARRDGDGYVVNGTKTWITNARRSDLVALLCKTDPAAEPVHRGISILLVEKVPGFEVSQDLPKLGYKGVESCELSFDDARVRARRRARRRRGPGVRPDDAGPRDRPHPGRRAGHRRRARRPRRRAALRPGARELRQADLAAPVRRQPARRHGHQADRRPHAAHARRPGLRLAATARDMEAGMAKLFGSESAMEVALSAIRVHGGYGYSTEFDVERYFRDAPLMIVGEGTNEIQRNVIVRQLVARGGI